MSQKPHPPLFPAQKSLLHGGDYYPEQWPEEIWDEDARLMKEAHVNSVTLGVFAWVTLQPEENRFDFDWLDRQMDLQARDGRYVALATPTAAPPAWMARKYPEILRTGADRVRRKHSNRVNYCWSSPIYREMCATIDTKLAERYGKHPALAFWHVSNEYGGQCYCNLCEARFRKWLRDRYGSLDALNAAYWNKFWSHTYTDWDEIEIPGDPYSDTSITGLGLDWRRFSSFQIVDFYCHETASLKAVNPKVPCTTNLMGYYSVLNPFEIAPHMDFISWDSYPWFSGQQFDADAWVQTSLLHDLNRGLKQKPFLLMECSPSASNWYSTWSAKRPGGHQLEGLQAVAHGADGVEYFQWRQGRGSMEQYHGAVMAHNNRKEAKVFQDVAGLGKVLSQLDDVVGSAVPSEIAIVYDWEVGWAIDTGLAYRTKRTQYFRTILDHYVPLHAANYEVDFVDSLGDYSKYRVLVAPMLYMLRPGVAANLARYVEEGGNLVLTYWSGWVDHNALAFQGGYPEPLRSVLGIWSEEMDELYPDQTNRISWNGQEYLVTDYCERIHVEAAEVVATYASDFYAGQPALTHNRFGKGSAYYVASRNEAAFNKDFLLGLAKELGIKPAFQAEAPAGVSVRRRRSADKEFLFVLNYANAPAEVKLSESKLEDAISGQSIPMVLNLPPFGSTVLVQHKTGPIGSSLEPGQPGAENP
jgi:beta-galactosidase